MSPASIQNDAPKRTITDSCRKSQTVLQPLASVQNPIPLKSRLSLIIDWLIGMIRLTHVPAEHSLGLRGTIGQLDLIQHQVINP